MSDPKHPAHDDAPDGPELLHEYDGIQEYDNPLPRWWVWTFWATILWAGLYFLLAILPPKVFSGEAVLAAEQAALTARTFGTLGELKPDNETVLKYARDPQWTAFGQGAFRSTCAACHNENAQGGAGPNLTDDAYLHAKEPADLFKVIRDGAKGGAMPAWSARFNDNEIIMLAAYVASLRGTNAPGGKAPEGAVPPEWK